jgi:hypothetical protein
MTKKNIFKIASEDAKGMTVEKMRQISQICNEMTSMLQSSEVDAWVQDHITTAHDDIMEVYSYLKQNRNQ